MVFDAFDLADCYRMPAMILADGMLGQMMEPISFPEKQVRTYDKSGWATSGHQHKRAHHIVNSLYLQPEELEAKILERFQRYEEVKAKHTRCEEYLVEDAEYVVVAYGATSRIVRSAVNTAREQGIKVGLIRPLAVPVRADRKGGRARREGVFERRDEHGPDGGRRPHRGQRQGARVLLRAHRRRHPDPRRGALRNQKNGRR